MAAAGDNTAQLAAMFSELKTLEGSGDYDKALKTTNKILNLSAGHPRAEHCKLVCLVQLGKFEEALKFAENISSELRNETVVEKAYCEYRLNRIPDALKTLGNNKTIAAQELRVQAHYRLGDFTKAYESYVELIKNSFDDYEDERMVNLSAALIGMTTEDKNNATAEEFLDESENIFEIVFNKACILITNERYEEALKKLSEAEKMCKQMLKADGASEDEIETELAAIRAQIAFCNQKLGKPEVALKLYTQVLRQAASNATLSAVVSGNIAIIKAEQAAAKLKEKNAPKKPASQPAAEKGKLQVSDTEMPSLEDVLQSVDIEYLEEKNWSLGVKYVKKTKDTPKPGEDKVEKKKKKKKRKIQLPKNYDPNVKPDPERWLPRVERSTYKKKKDKKGVGKGTQGSTGDMPEVKQTVVQPSPQGPRAQRPTNKKKKKGGRK